MMPRGRNVRVREGSIFVRAINFSPLFLLNHSEGRIGLDHSSSSYPQLGKRVFSNKLLVAVLTLAVVFSCLAGATLFIFWGVLNVGLLTGSKEGEVPNQTSTQRFTIITEAAPSRLDTTTPEATALALLQNAATATPLLLPEPTDTLAPTPIPTQVIVDYSTATPTPSPTPPPTIPPPPATPIPAPSAIPTPTRQTIEHVIVISIDGLRPDALEMADTPTLDALRLAGAYSPRGKAVWPSDTMPNHASMLGGMVPDKHGIMWNILYDEAPYIKGPTLFTVAHQAGLQTAFIAGKFKMERLVLPNSVDQFISDPDDLSDDQVKELAVNMIRTDLPSVFVIHFPGVDKIGHQSGWMSADQRQVITSVDGLLGQIVAALEAGGYLQNTLLIVTADHGGSEGTHGSPSPEDTTIPWLAVGPGVPASLTLSTDIFIYDTAATVLYALGLPLPETWDGQPILEIFAE